MAEDIDPQRPFEACIVQLKGAVVMERSSTVCALRAVRVAAALLYALYASNSYGAPPSQEPLWNTQIDILDLLMKSQPEVPKEFREVADKTEINVRALGRENLAGAIVRVSSRLRDAGVKWRIVIVVDPQDVAAAEDLKKTPFSALLKNAKVDTRTSLSVSEVLAILRDELAFGIRYSDKTVYLGQTFN